MIGLWNWRHSGSFCGLVGDIMNDITIAALRGVEAFFHWKT
jgi:hypothetical protein